MLNFHFTACLCMWISHPLLFTGYDNAEQSRFSWDFMCQALQPNEKVKKNASQYIVTLYSNNQNLTSNFMFLPIYNSVLSPYSVVLTFMFLKLEETPLTNPIGCFSKHSFL